MAFDWSDIVVGHWLVQKRDGRDKHGAQLYRCVSRCGVAHHLTASSLADGGPATCHGCRSGSAGPAAARVVDEARMPEHHFHWRTGVQVIMCLKNREAISDWDEHGWPELKSILESAKFGGAFGWRVTVREARQQPAGAKKHTHVRLTDPSQKRVEVSVRPPRSRYEFIVDLAGGRNHPFGEIGQAIGDAISRLVETAAPPPPPPEPAAASLVDVIAGMDLGQLMDIRAGIDTLHIAGTAIQATTQKKAAAAARLQAAEGAAVAASLAVKTTADELSRAVGAKAALDRRRAELQSELDRLAKELAAAATAVADATAARDLAAEAVGPATEAAEMSRLEYDDVVAEVEKHAKVVAAGNNLAPLLAALSRLTGK